MPRGPSPAPLKLRSSDESSRRRPGSISSSISDQQMSKVGKLRCFIAELKANEGQESPKSSTFEDYRKELGGHTSTSRKKSCSVSKPHSPTVNVYTHCGRHSDQYLFGGWSNIVKSTFKKE
ncbi:uncharacterized protein GGS25DRAFT_109162 [Hypoxylon fragiforme]|uniref:uncharacterized protein n=1 Tax=Hypoxylon fragiforme TaxID=63214 RepID=UPI0020C60205|nr:uncharacterized protein GGS25DRAFT_109162 [Hypoxylon fragiforme]KAI2612168.1 hypothetical protein GGS25DRAFT_109162 [Hypoxylon fragiforme]